MYAYLAHHPRRRQRFLAAPAMFAITAAALAGLPAALGDVPSYAIRVVDDGYPTAINNRGEIVGARLGAPGRAWFSDPYGRRVDLPVPAGAVTTAAADINESGLVVGTATFAGGTPHACSWSLVDGEWQVALLDELPVSFGSYATAVNDLGDIVGTAIVTLGSHAVLFTGPEGPIDLYELGLTQAPADVNNARQVVGNQLILDLDDGSLIDIGVPPPMGGSVHFLWSLTSAMNDAGQTVGLSVLATSTDDDRVATRYDPESGWQLLSGPGPYNTASDINDHGDVLMSIASSWGQQPYLRIEGTGTYRVQTLLGPGLELWYIENFGATAINDHRQLALVVSNDATQQYGAALLTPLGSMIIPGDVNGDAVVEPADLCAWIAEPVDVDGNGAVGPEDQTWLEDLLTELGYWVGDCNTNGMPDPCDIAAGTSLDCDGDGIPDECQADCDGDGVPDVCESDCNGNGVPDDCDIAGGASEDCNFNGVPDECDVAELVHRGVVHEPPLPIPASATIHDTILVTDPGMIADLDLRLDLRYRIGDLTVRLSHLGTTVTILDRPGFPAYAGGFVNFGYDATIDDEGAGPFLENVGDFCCTFEWIESPPSYRPDDALSAFDGMPLAGEWTLEITTTNVSPLATLLSWTLDLLDEAVPVPPCNPADVDGDGVIGFADLLMVLSAWGPCVDCPEDVNGDGIVDFADLILVLSGWGAG